MNKCLMSLVAIACLASMMTEQASASSDWLFFSDGVWQSAPLNSLNYTAVAGDSVAHADGLFARADGGVDRIYWTGADWGRDQNVLPTSYQALGSSVAPGNVGARYFGALVGGGLEWIWNDGTWHNTSVNSVEYAALAGDSVQAASVLAARAGGGVDWIYFDYGVGDWARDQSVLSGNYVALGTSHGSAGEGKRFFGARAGGGLDWIWFDGAWQSAEVSALSYGAIAGDATQEAAVLAARTDGGVDWTWYDYAGGGWMTQSLVYTSTLTALGTDGTSHANFFGAANPVPEPNSIVVMMGGLAGLAGFRIKRRK